MKISDVLFASYGTPENYQYGLCHAVGSQFIVENYLIENTSLIIDANNSVFGDPCGGTGKLLSIVITIEVDPTYVAPSPTPSPEPTQSQSPQPTLEPSPQPTEPSPQPSQTPEPPLEPSPTPTPSESESEAPEPVVSPTQSPEPEPSSPSEPTPSPEESPSPDPTPSSTEIPSNNLTTDEAVAEILEEYGTEEAIPFSVLQEAGIEYSDLPTEQPVTLENGVILTAGVADALQSFDSLDNLLDAALTDPKKLVKAFANVGADMTPEQRKESQIIVVASIIVGQIISTTSLITGRIR